jgi:multidrug efflux pump subunit AcrA (membrane-fusion protein)
MEWISNIVSYGLAITGVTGVAIASANVNNVSPNKINEPVIQQEIIATTTSPRRLNVTVKVAEPDDLKIGEGQEVKRGDVIADRERERTRLTAQQKQLQLSLNRLASASITPPATPSPVPTVMALPPVSYLEHEAAVEKTKAAIASLESQVNSKKEELNYLSQISNLDPIILEHEQANLAELKQKHTAAIRDYQLAMGKLQSAKDSRKYQEYQASVTEAQRIEQMNQARLNYQQQLSEYEQRLADREFQVSQLQAKLNEVSNAIASLATVKSPYSGTVRRVKWLGQSPDGSLTAEVTLMVNDSQQSAASLSEQ